MILTLRRQVQSSRHFTDHLCSLEKTTSFKSLINEVHLRLSGTHFGSLLDSPVAVFYAGENTEWGESGEKLRIQVPAKSSQHSENFNETLY